MNKMKELVQKRREKREPSRQMYVCMREKKSEKLLIARKCPLRRLLQ